MGMTSVAGLAAQSVGQVQAGAQLNRAVAAVKQQANMNAAVVQAILEASPGPTYAANGAAQPNMGTGNLLNARA